MKQLYHDSAGNASGDCDSVQECVICDPRSTIQPHLWDCSLSLKAKGLLSYMLYQPASWDYTIRGLAELNRDNADSIRTGMNELIKAGYVQRIQLKDEHGRFTGNQYLISEYPVREGGGTRD